MDYRALGELIWFTCLGLSVFAGVTGLSVRLFLAPVIRDMLGRSASKASEDQRVLAARVGRMEEQLGEVESHLHRLAAAEEFRRRLESGEEKR